MKIIRELFDELVKEMENPDEYMEDIPEPEEKSQPAKPEQATDVVSSIRNKLQKPKKKEETPVPETITQPKYDYTIPEDCVIDIVNQR